jgi:tetratricopeptide (TPR) repeat protein
MMSLMTRHSRRLNVTISIILGVVTLAVFWPVRNYDFVLYDDGQYVFENPHVASGLSWANLVWAVTRFHSGNWHPLTWISHMVDVQLFAMNPGMHHLTNAFLHSANAILLFLLLNAMTGAIWRSAVVAGLFALHPAHVESVAWVAERKDVLSTFFGLLALLAYSKYVSSVERRAEAKSEIPSSKPESIPKQEKEKCFAFISMSANYPAFFYSLALLCFAFGLMSKPMLVTLPFVMLLVDFWPLGRVPHFEGREIDVVKRLLLEKIPFFCLTIASCVMTYLAQKSEGAVDTLQRVPFEARLANAVVAYVDYLQKLVWPSKLAILYLRPEHWAVLQVTFAVVLLAGLTLLVALGSRRWPWMAVGWFWFLGTLVPVVGLIQVGNQYMADRYTYFPYIGCFILIAWGTWQLAKNSLFGAIAVNSVALISIVAAAGLTHHQLQYWKNSETLFGHCLAVTMNNFSAHNILGVTMARQNRFEEAKYHFFEALRIQPQYADSLQNLGILLTEHGDFDEALPYLRRAVDVKPESAIVFSKLGLLLDFKGQPEHAIVYYRECLRLKPDQEDACNNLAWLLATSPEDRFRDGAEAVRIAEHVCEVTGYQKAALIGTLAAAYAEAGRFREATEAAEKAIQVASAEGETSLVGRNKELLELYRARKPYHEPRSKAPPAQ